MPPNKYMPWNNNQTTILVIWPYATFTNSSNSCQQPNFEMFCKGKLKIKGCVCIFLITCLSQQNNYLSNFVATSQHCIIKYNALFMYYLNQHLVKNLWYIQTNIKWIKLNVVVITIVKMTHQIFISAFAPGS